LILRGFGVFGEAFSQLFSTLIDAVLFP